MGRTTPLTWRQYDTFVHEWTDRYLSGDEAFTIGGRPVCSFLNITDFAACYGTTTFAIMLRYLRAVGTRRGGRAPFLLGVIGRVDEINLALANALPIDGVTGYGLLPNWLGDPVQDYASLVRERVAEWHWLQSRLRVPFFPVACAGWDASGRGAPMDQLRSQDGYPYVPIVENAGPEPFGAFIDEALAFNQRWHPEHDVVFLHAWNEWTECSVLEPSDRDGEAYLHQVRRRRIAPVAPAVAGR
jgi:hypothetical protein